MQAPHHKLTQIGPHGQNVAAEGERCEVPEDGLNHGLGELHARA